MTDTIAPADLHPCPQLRRERWTDLCGPWGFAFDLERLRAINSRPSKAVPSEILDVLIKQEVERRRRERGQE
jgi:hypothetical protein